MVMNMKGLDLARAYYERYGAEMIRSDFAPYSDRIAVGLAGEGSECFGFDDAISRDHDFGPSFCMWLTKEDYALFGAELQKAYDSLPKDFMGFAPRQETPESAGRIGVICMDDFFRNHTGRIDAEYSPMDWLSVPESRLATVTNGEVFTDPLGRFTEIRNKLKAFYPEDIRLKKMAARAAAMGQSGQYNYPRCMKRGETVAAAHCISEFIQNTLSMVHLINRRYMPYYKWMHRSTMSLPVLGEGIGNLVRDLAENGVSQDLWECTDTSQLEGALNFGDPNVLIIEQICRLVISELRLEGLSSNGSSFILDHGADIMSQIGDPQIRSLHLMIG